MSNLGLGVMIGMLGGNEETVTALRDRIGKTISSVVIDDEAGDAGELRITFSDGKVLKIWDDGQTCCESRYRRTDDKVEDFIGATLLDAECFAGDPIEDGGEDHEVQFLRLKTDKGTLVVHQHNEHNGYYGGFWVQASLE